MLQQIESRVSAFCRIPIFLIAADFQSVWFSSSDHVDRERILQLAARTGPLNPLEHEPSRGSPKRLNFMYRCQLCQCVVPPRTPANHLVVKWRSTDYTKRARANSFVRKNE